MCVYFAIKEQPFLHPKLLIIITSVLFKFRNVKWSCAKIKLCRKSVNTSLFLSLLQKIIERLFNFVEQFRNIQKSNKLKLSQSPLDGSLLQLQVYQIKGCWQQRKEVNKMLTGQSIVNSVAKDLLKDGAYNFLVK